MKKVLVLFAGVILSVSIAQAKESSLNSIFEEPGKQGVLKQLAAVSKVAGQNNRRQSKGKAEAISCPGEEMPERQKKKRKV